MITTGYSEKLLCLPFGKKSFIILWGVPIGFFVSHHEDEYTKYLEVYEVRREFLKKSILILLCCLLMVSISFATSGGGGKNNPLTLDSSNPEQGQKDVALSTEIKLTFSKNVVNMKVKDENEKCFALETADGTNIPIEVQMADDQIEPDKKNDVILVPKEELKEGTTYTVKVSPQLQSKSGVSIEDELNLTFTTLGGSKNTESGNKNIMPILGVLLIAILIGMKVKKSKNV